MILILLSNYQTINLELLLVINRIQLFLALSISYVYPLIVFSLNMGFIDINCSIYFHLSSSHLFLFLSSFGLFLLFTVSLVFPGWLIFSYSFEQNTEQFFSLLSFHDGLHVYVVIRSIY